MWYPPAAPSTRALGARHGAQEPARIALLLDNILPGLRDLPAELAPDEELRTAVEANVRWSTHQILETPEARARFVEGTMKLVAACTSSKAGACDSCSHDSIRPEPVAHAFTHRRIQPGKERRVAASEVRFLLPSRGNRQGVAWSQRVDCGRLTARDRAGTPFEAAARRSISGHLRRSSHRVLGGKRQN
jgi:hypothetical protein